MKQVKIWMLIVAVTFLAGCVAHVSKTGAFDAQSASLGTGSHVIAYTNFIDQRGGKDKDKVGMISALLLKTQRPIGDIIADRIAYDLHELKNLGIQKVFLQDPFDQDSIVKAIRAKNADLYVAGVVREFDIASVDAIMDPANGHVQFEIKVYNPRGEVIYENVYEARTRHYIGMSSTIGSDKAIEKTYRAASDELLKDTRFDDVINSLT